MMMGEGEEMTMGKGEGTTMGKVSGGGRKGHLE